MNEYLNKITSKYRWICSGTPHHNKNSFRNILNYITDINIDKPLDLYKHQINNIINILFRKNTKNPLKIK